MTWIILSLIAIDIIYLGALWFAKGYDEWITKR
jgi:hypothetical protein